MFCSSKCLSKSGQSSKSIFIKINCLHCDKEFEKSITNVKTVDQIYCSKNCCVVYQNTNRDKEEQLKINTKPSVEVLNNYYTKTEVDNCLQVLSQSIDSINACVITLSGQIASLQNNISKL